MSRCMPLPQPYIKAQRRNKLQAILYNYQAPVYKEPFLTIPGIPGIVQHEILNNRRQVLTKDAAGSVKLLEITRGVIIEDYGKSIGSFSARTHFYIHVI